MPVAPKAILFDFDGVIVNSEPLHYLAYREALLTEQIEISESDYYSEAIGFDDRGAFNHIFAARGRVLDPKTFLRLMAARGKQLRSLIAHRNFSALPGVEQFVRAIYRDYPLAIYSGGVRDEIEMMLEAISLRDCFSVVLGAEDVSVGKPDPQGYLLAAQMLSEKFKLNLTPKECLVIEDAPTVIESVKKAGFRTLGIATTYSPERLAGADHVVKSLRVEDVLDKLPKLRTLIR